MSLTQYLETEIAQIREDWERSGSNMSLNEYALAWIEANAEKFEHDHDR